MTNTTQTIKEFETNQTIEAARLALLNMGIKGTKALWDVGVTRWDEPCWEIGTWGVSTTYDNVRKGAQKLYEMTNAA